MTPPIIGRAEELSVLTRFFDRESSGACGIVIEGEAGIGKTAVWREAVRLAGATGTVLRARASEVEARLAFTVLGDLLVTQLDEGILGRLPVGQRRGLEAALLLDELSRARPDSRAVSLAVLAVIRMLATTEPLTIAIDDVQWVDASSARTLAFALRRLESEAVAVVAARRVGSGPGEPLDLAHNLPAGLERLTLAPLDETSLGRMLRGSLGRDFPPPLVTKIHEQTAGNPFFAIEIGRALGAETPSLRPGKLLPVPRDLEELLSGRFSSLSPDARFASLLIAASPRPTRDVVQAAGGSEAGVEELVDDGIVAVEEARLDFTHPLLASTVYRTALPRVRRRAHARLADLAPNREERARHLALSTDRPDEEIARALADAAQQAEDRGAPLAAAELFELAASLTPPPSDLIRVRLLRAASNLFDAGDGDGARRMVEELVHQLGPGAGRADALRFLSFMSWNDVLRASEVQARALDEAAEDPFLRSMILGEMAWAEFQGCRPAIASDLARSALALAELLPDPAPKRVALSVLSMAEAVLGRPTQELNKRAAALEGKAAPGESSGASITLGRQLLWAGDLRSARTVLEATLERSLDRGREAATWEMILRLAEVEHRAGRWSIAASRANDALKIALETGRSNFVGEILSLRAGIEAAMGHADRAREDGLESLSVCERIGDRWFELHAHWALGFLELSLGDHGACHAWLDPLVSFTEEMELEEPGAIPFVPDEVEALVALGELEAAARLTDRLERQGNVLDRPLALSTAARCRGLILGARQDLDLAEELLGRAVAEHAAVPQPFERARTLLIAGTIHRRNKKKRSARELLQEALEIFDELGAPLWSAKARAELARIGGRAGVGELTDTERAVADLAADGTMNQEIADRMFISVKTVEANLSRVYRKLQIRSRRELPKALGRLKGGGEQT